MKKNILILLVASLAFSSCGTYGSYGAGEGAYWGSILGSAIGGIAGGHRGHDVGTLVGIAGGALVGAAVADAKHDNDMDQYRQEKARLAARRQARKNKATGAAPDPVYDYRQGAAADSGFDSSNGGDDRIDIDFSDNSGAENYDFPGQAPVAATPKIEIRNVRFIDADNDGAMKRGEQCSIAFEIFNRGGAAAYNLQPVVQEVSGCKHIFISPSVLIENINAHRGVSYTARVVASKSLKKGTVRFSVAVNCGNQQLEQMTFEIPTKK